jgi:hypothetical protein
MSAVDPTNRFPRFPILKFFAYAHLPAVLQSVSKPYCDLAEALAQQGSPDYAEVAAGLRKLLEAKDCAVRAALSVPKETE